MPPSQRSGDSAPKRMQASAPRKNTTTPKATPRAEAGLPPKPQEQGVRKKKKVTVQVPPQQERRDIVNESVDLEAGLAAPVAGPATVQRDSAVQVHDDEDVQKAARQGYISGPCDCFLSFWALLGDAAEGGAEQIVGLLLLPLSGLLLRFAQNENEHRTHPFAMQGKAATNEDFLDRIASSHPIIYLATDLGEQRMRAAGCQRRAAAWIVHSPHSHRDVSHCAYRAQLLSCLTRLLTLLSGGLLLISLLVLFEADLHRWYRESKARARGYVQLSPRTLHAQETTKNLPLDGMPGAVARSFSRKEVKIVADGGDFAKPLKLMRDRT